MRAVWTCELCRLTWSRVCLMDLVVGQVCTACQEKELILFEHNEGVTYPMLVGDAVRLHQVLDPFCGTCTLYSLNIHL